MVCRFRAELHATVNDSFEVFHCDNFGTKCTEDDHGLLTVLSDPLPVCNGCKARIEITIPQGTDAKSNFCYWSCDTTPNGPAILKTMVASARAAGVQEDFHVFAHKDAPGATTHKPGPLDIKGHIFKWTLLRDRLAELDYEFFVWVDSDTIFTRHPGNLKNLIRDNAMWCQLESELTSPNLRHPDWWGAPVGKFLELLTNHGVTGERKWNSNGGMWVVRKEAIETFVREALAFYQLCLSLGWNAHDETALAWIGQLEHVSGYGSWVADKHLNTNAATCETWSCQWMGSDRPIPDGQPWLGEDYMTGKRRVCNPAIVHAMRSKKAMAAEGKRLRGLGDLVAAVTHATGIDKAAKMVAKGVGAKDCGCGERQTKLNQLVPFRS